MNLGVKLQYFGILVTKILPLKLVDRIACNIGRLCCFLLKKKRRLIGTNLSYIFSSERICHERYNKYVKKTFENFACSMVDFFRLGYLTGKEIIENVEGIGIENVSKALKFKRGCLLITLHIGNWDYAGAYLAALGLPINALVEETTPRMFELYTKHRERTGLKTFTISKAGYAFLDTIKNNRILAVLADRDITMNGTSIKFFSGKRNIPRNLAPIIIKKKLPVVFGYMVLNLRHKKKRYLGVIESPLFFNDEIEFNKFMVKKFEGVIRRYPDQWFVFHPEWIE